MSFRSSIRVVSLHHMPTHHSEVVKKKDTKGGKDPKDEKASHPSAGLSVLAVL